MKWLDGKKSYIGFIMGGVLGLAWSLGLISEHTMDMLEPIVVALCGVGIAHKADKLIKATKGE